MKRLALAAILAASTAAPANAGMQDFTLVNSSDYTIMFVYGSADYEDVWSPDLLGQDVLYPGEQLYISVNGYDNHCWFDLMVEDETGEQFIYYDMDLCVETHIYFDQ